jgi:hypothetical protein
MPEVSITLDDLYGALREAGFTGSADAEGKTTLELCEVWKCSKAFALKQIAIAKKAGVLRTGWKRAERVDGQMTNVPVYQFVFDTPKKTKAKR